MKHKHHFPIGLRTAKSALAVALALFVVEHYGASSSKLIFALMGALSAMEPTFKGAVRNCLTQICGVAFGAFFGIWMRHLPIDSIYIIGIGVLLIITVYHMLHLTLAPALPCIVLVTVCTTPITSTVVYATQRLWDTAIGLGIGLAVNMLLFPYNNSRQIRRAIRSLDEELMRFLEDFFDGDDHLPDAEEMQRTIREIDRQLALFADQRLLRRKRQKTELDQYQQCEDMALRLVSELEALSHLPRAGRLSGVVKQRLVNGGCTMLDERTVDFPDEIDIVTDYHVGRILSLRRKLREALEEMNRWERRKRA